MFNLRTITILVVMFISIVGCSSSGHISYPPVPTIIPSVANSINLPLPRHKCPMKSGTIVNADSIGKGFIKALKENDVVGHNRVTAMQMVQSFSDVMGCFISGQDVVSTGRVNTSKEKK